MGFGIVVPYWNPTQSPVLYNHIQTFCGWLQHQHVPCLVVQLARTIEDFVTLKSNVNQRLILGDPFLWQKELLLNIGARQLIKDYGVSHVAWWDMDTYPLTIDWQPIVEELCKTCCAFQIPGYILRDGVKRGSIIRHGVAHGGAWCLDSALWDHGLYEYDILGGGDTTMLHGLRGAFFFERHAAWAASFVKSVTTRIGCARIPMLAMSHGLRDYPSRNRLYEHYTPGMLDKNSYGGLEWNDPDDLVVAAVRAYTFRRCN
jgi:hypothetical protein